MKWFFDKLKRWFDYPEENRLEKKLLRAAHYLATQWEFGIIYHFNQAIYGIDATKAAIESNIEDHYDFGRCSENIAERQNQQIY